MLTVHRSKGKHSFQPHKTILILPDQESDILAIPNTLLCLLAERTHQGMVQIASTALWDMTYVFPFLRVLNIMFAYDDRDHGMIGFEFIALSYWFLRTLVGYFLTNTSFPWRVYYWVWIFQGAASDRINTGLFTALELYTATASQFKRCFEQESRPPTLFKWRLLFPASQRPRHAQRVKPLPPAPLTPTLKLCGAELILSHELDKHFLPFWLPFLNIKVSPLSTDPAAWNRFSRSLLLRMHNICFYTTVFWAGYSRRWVIDRSNFAISDPPPLSQMTNSAFLHSSGTDSVVTY